MRFRFRVLISLVAAWLAVAGLLPVAPGVAQEGQPGRPVYIVQEGDSLWSIALRFGVSMNELLIANGMSDGNQLAIGARLVIPGLEGIDGVLTTQRVAYGETLRTLAHRLRVPVEVLVRLNHLGSPAELYAGANLVVPVQEETQPGLRRALLAPGQSLLELAVLHDANPWTVMTANSLPGAWAALPGEVLFLPAAEDDNGPPALPEAVQAVTVQPLPLVQGKSVTIKLKGEPGMQLSGSLAGRELHFLPVAAGGEDYVSLQGIHAMTTPGLYPLSLSGTLADGTPFAFSQPVFVRGGEYPYDPVLIVSPETIDPAVTQPEEAQWSALAAPFNPEKLWQGRFETPTQKEFADCWPSRFGNRRSYNGSAYLYYHTGLDFCGQTGTEIYAPAAGVVVFAGPLTVRGNATMIDHGWGVYTGYFHQDKILVQPGDRVKPGQLIGLVGRTGRVTGAHLHFEVWVGGVLVDPLDWLEQEYP